MLSLRERQTQAAQAVAQVELWAALQERAQQPLETSLARVREALVCGADPHAWQDYPETHPHFCSGSPLDALFIRPNHLMHGERKVFDPEVWTLLWEAGGCREGSHSESRGLLHGWVHLGPAMSDEERHGVLAQMLTACDVNRTHEGSTALDEALHRGSWACAELLWEAGARLNGSEPGRPKSLALLMDPSESTKPSAARSLWLDRALAHSTPQDLYAVTLWGHCAMHAVIAHGDLALWQRMTQMGLLDWTRVPHLEPAVEEGYARMRAFMDAHPMPGDDPLQRTYSPLAALHQRVDREAARRRPGSSEAVRAVFARILACDLASTQEATDAQRQALAQALLWTGIGVRDATAVQEALTRGAQAWAPSSTLEWGARHLGQLPLDALLEGTAHGPAFDQAVWDLLWAAERPAVLPAPRSGQSRWQAWVTAALPSEAVVKVLGQLSTLEGPEASAAGQQAALNKALREGAWERGECLLDAGASVLHAGLMDDPLVFQRLVADSGTSPAGHARWMARFLAHATRDQMHQMDAHGGCKALHAVQTAPVDLLEALTQQGVLDWDAVRLGRSLHAHLQHRLAQMAHAQAFEEDQRALAHFEAWLQSQALSQRLSAAPSSARRIRL